MPPYEVTSPFSAAAGAAGSFLGAMQQQRQYQAEQERQKRIDAYQQALAQQGAERLGLEVEREKRDEEQYQRGVRQEEAVRRQNAALKYPAHWDKMSPQQQIMYLRNRQAAQQGIGNVEGFTETGRQISQLESDIRQAAQDARNNAYIQRTLQIQPGQFQQGLQVREQGFSDAMTRAANAQAGAWARFMAGQQGQEERQQERFQHQEKTKKPALDPVLQNQVKLLMDDVKHTMSKHPESSLSEIRAAALKQGYPQAAVDAVLGKGPAPAASPAPQGNMLQQIWSNIMK